MYAISMHGMKLANASIPVATVSLDGHQAVFEGGDEGLAALIPVHAGLLDDGNGR